MSSPIPPPPNQPPPPPSGPPPSYRPPPSQPPPSQPPYAPPAQHPPAQPYAQQPYAQQPYAQQPPAQQPVTGRPVEVAMSSKKKGDLALRFGIALAVTLGLVLVPNRRTEDWNALGKVGLVVLVVVLIIAVAAMLPVRFTVDQRGLTVRRLAGFTRQVAWGEIGGGVFVHHLLAPAQAAARDTSRLFLRDRSGAKILQLTSQSAGRDELLTLVGALGQDRFEQVTEPVSAKELGARYPGMVSVFERRPVLIGMLAAVVIIAVVVVGVLLFADY